MSLSTLEHLSDEILILIIKYSDDPLNIIRAFIGLNQRLNKIIFDRHLHLFTKCLY